MPAREPTQDTSGKAIKERGAIDVDIVPVAWRRNQSIEADPRLYYFGREALSKERFVIVIRFRDKGVLFHQAHAHPIQVLRSVAWMADPVNSGHRSAVRQF